MSFPLKVEGVQFPSPATYGFTEFTLMENFERNNAGYANWDVVRPNIGRLDLVWDKVHKDEIVQIVGVIRSKKSFYATFLNSNTGEMETREFYAGDRANEMARFISVLDYWSNLTVPFVEV